MDQSDLEASTERNQRAWNAQRFEAWMSRYKSPEVEARVIAANPQHVARRIYPYLGEVEGKQICNVQGSHGRMAVALALMGADVHVIDFSEGNQKFASALANAAGVKIDYTVCDILNISQVGLRHRFDCLVLELGILHYHQYLDRFFAVMRYLLAENGVLILNEFHPVQRKLFWPDGPRDYFHDQIIKAEKQ